MTYNNNHRLVFRLVPNACDFAESDDHFGEFKEKATEVLTVKEDYGNEQEARQVVKSKQNHFMGKLRKFNETVYDVRGIYQNLLSRDAKSLSSSHDSKNKK